MFDYFKNIFEFNFFQISGKKSKIVLGVVDKRLVGEIIFVFIGVQCEFVEIFEVVVVFFCGICVYVGKFFKGFQEGDINCVQFGFGYVYFCVKVKFSVYKNDNYIIQGIVIFDVFDKGINQGVMCVREWYGWYFFEFICIVFDNGIYVKMVIVVGNKKIFIDESVDEIVNVFNQDQDKVEVVIQVVKVFMGQDISEIDFVMIKDFVFNVVEMVDYRCIFVEFFDKKMGDVVFNFQVIFGIFVVVCFIFYVGFLINFVKYFVFIFQIFGVEKVFFCVFKIKGVIFKYGFFY